jgi:hypothetical protein
MIEFYGFNCNNKWIGYFTNGLTLPSFLTTIIILIFIKISGNITNEILIKICLSISILSKLFSYLLIKYNSTEIFELSRELKKFQTNSSQLNINIFSIFSILFSALLAFILTENYFCIMNITELFEDLNEKIDSLLISSYLQNFDFLSYFVVYCESFTLYRFQNSIHKYFERIQKRSYE